MKNKMLSLILMFLVSFSSGCLMTTTTALTTVAGVATTKVIEHRAGYGMQSPHTVIERVMPSVVTILSELPKGKESNSPKHRFMKPNELREQRQRPQPRNNQNQFQSGTGFVIHEDGTVITNFHVIANVVNNDGKGKFQIFFSNDSIYPAELFNYDKTSDIAILKIKHDDGVKFKHLKWGPKPKLGGHAIVIGSPIGLDFSVSFGIISAIDRIIPKASPPFVPYIQTDASMNRGNSGGPLFDSKGRVVGINTLILTPPSREGIDIGSVGLGFAIDGTYAQDIIKRLQAGHKIVWSFLGIHYRLLNYEETKSNKLNFGSNIIVVKVTPEGPANGLLKENDIIQKMNGKVVTHKLFASMIARLEPGTKINLDIFRDKKPMNIDIVLAERTVI